MFAIDVETGRINTIVRDGCVRTFDVTNDRIVYGLNNLQSPVELYSVKADGGDVQRITHINSKKLAVVQMGEYEQFSFEGWNNETVYCYIVKPVEFNPAKKYPVAF